MGTAVDSMPGANVFSLYAITAEIAYGMVNAISCGAWVYKLLLLGTVEPHSHLCR